MMEKFNKLKKNKQIEEELYAGELLLVSANFWISEFDKLVKQREELEKSEERFELYFSEKMDSLNAKIDIAAAHMNLEKEAIKKILKKLNNH